MVYFLKLDGTMTLAEPQRVFQGSNNVNTVYVLSAIAPPTALEISFTLPSGLTTAYYPMIYNGATDEYTVPNTATTVYLRSFLLTSNITAEVGTVGVSVNAVYSNADGTTGNQTSFTGSFNVEYSSIPETVTTGAADELQQALDLLSQYYTQQQAIITGGTNGEYLQSQGDNQLPVWTSFDMDFVAVNRAQSLSNAQKAQARTNIDVYSKNEIDDSVVKYSSGQSLTDTQKAQARTNIGAVGSADSQYTVKVVEQTFTEEQKTQARTNIGALSSADLSVWSQRTTGEEDLNVLANVANGKAYISRYAPSTANTPAANTYGNVISFRNSGAGLTQLAMGTQGTQFGKIYFREAAEAGFGTWKEVDTIKAKNLGTQTGYIKYSSGLIIQWGVTNSADGSWTGTITFPISFTSSTSYIPVAFPSAQTISVSYSILSADNLTFGRNTSSGALDIYWIATGY